jgi:hypothetical protein
MSLHEATGTSHQTGEGPDNTFSTSAADPSIPSDNDILNEVDRVEESPGPENPALPTVPVHKFLRGTQGEYEKLDSSAYGGSTGLAIIRGRFQ